MENINKVIVIPQKVVEEFGAKYNNDMLALALHRGKVLDLSEFSELSQKEKLEHTHIEFVSLDDTCDEWCAECENEVELPLAFRRMVCPNCGKPIKPCNLCGGICLTPCPLDKFITFNK
jgi:predicted RNA-binding Zn-ribbon protein involved in translation (DUF1610 family)